MQEMVKTMTHLSQSVDQLQRPIDEPIEESLLDEDPADGEPAAKTQCLHGIPPWKRLVHFKYFNEHFEKTDLDQIDKNLYLAKHLSVC